MEEIKSTMMPQPANPPASHSSNASIILLFSARLATQRRVTEKCGNISAQKKTLGIIREGGVTSRPGWTVWTCNGPCVRSLRGVDGDSARAAGPARKNQTLFIPATPVRGEHLCGRRMPPAEYLNFLWRSFHGLLFCTESRKKNACVTVVVQVVVCSFSPAARCQPSVRRSSPRGKRNSRASRSRDQ